MLREGRTTLYTPISISSILEAYINRLANMSSKWEIGQD
jgi:sugar-specific transcriptional regulator TrmB